MPWAQTLCDLSPHLSLHTSACALVSACCSFLSSFSQRVSHGTQPPKPPHLPLSAPCAHPYVHAYAQSTCMRTQREGEYSAALTVAGFDATFTLLLSGLLRPNNPVCSRPCTEVSELSVNNLHAVSAGFRTLCWCITGSHRK